MIRAPAVPEEHGRGPLVHSETKRFCLWRKALQIIIQSILSRGGLAVQFLQLSPFPVDPDLDEPLGEHAALGEVIVVGLQGIQRLFQRFGETVNLRFVFLRQGIEVKVIRPSEWQRKHSRGCRWHRGCAAQSACSSVPWHRQGCVPPHCGWPWHSRWSPVPRTQAPGVCRNW